MLSLRPLLRCSVLTFTVILIVNLLFLWTVGAHIPRELFRNRGDEGNAAGHYVKSSFDWGKLMPHFPVPSMVSLPTGAPVPLPRVQHQFQRKSQEDNARIESYRATVKQAFQKCWSSYRNYAWMQDELTPISGRGKETFAGWGATLIDSLDTLHIMDLKKEFKEAAEAVATIDFAKTTSKSANMFETNIRYLGGLLSAYDLSQEHVLLLKATEMGNLLYAGFDTPNNLPPYWIDFDAAKNGKLLAENNTPLAVPGSLSLEFTRLSQLTKDPKYYDAINRIALLLESNQNSTKHPGLWPVRINLQKVDLVSNKLFSIGGEADSAYEYLPKMHNLLSGLDSKYVNMSQVALDAIKNNLLFRPMLPNGEDILFAGDARINSMGMFAISAKMQHLSCFAGGMFALSSHLFNRPEYLETGKKLTEGCIWAYSVFPTGIMPEDFEMLPCQKIDNCPWDKERWQNYGGVNLPPGVRNVGHKEYILRPEAIESVFILYRITGDVKYQEAAWTMFKAIMAATETKYGNAAIEDVLAKGRTVKKDSMESFWMSETLKYFYLIFSPPDLISLDDYVFNTEAHPLRRVK